MHGACHQVYLDRKLLNTKRLSPYSRSKSVAESFRGWDWLFRFWDAPLQRPRDQSALRFLAKGLLPIV